MTAVGDDVDPTTAVYPETSFHIKNIIIATTWPQQIYYSGANAEWTTQEHPLTHSASFPLPFHSFSSVANGWVIITLVANVYLHGLVQFIQHMCAGLKDLFWSDKYVEC